MALKLKVVRESDLTIRLPSIRVFPIPTNLSRESTAAESGSCVSFLYPNPQALISGDTVGSNAPAVSSAIFFEAA